jgi:hypothetical protein
VWLAGEGPPLWRTSLGVRRDPEGHTDEAGRIIEYFTSQAPDETVEFAQMVHAEQLHSIRHEIWDVHTNKGRWWVITNPTNLYSQEQFPNMDLALTFHIGLSIRVPRGEEDQIDVLALEPLVAPWRALGDIHDALGQASEVEDCQAIGVRCREVLLTLVHEAQRVVSAPADAEPPKKSDFNAWAQHIADTAYTGASYREHRQLLKSHARSSWDFTNWLTHAKDAALSDAETAVQVTEQTLSLYTGALTRLLRGVPDRCPRCGSLRLSPERARDPENPTHIFERPACLRCEWKGEPTQIGELPVPESSEPSGECYFMESPLRRRNRPWAPDA